MSTIDIDDLANPIISAAGQAVLARRAAAPVPLDIGAIIDWVKPQLDVPFFEDEGLIDRLQRFIREGNERQGGFSAAGRGTMALALAGIFIQRSRIEGLFKKFPEINDVQINPPLIIAGIPRSGTTNLSNIISADKHLNSITFWEGIQPAPSLGMVNGDEVDTRSEGWKHGLEDKLKVVPYYKNMFDVQYDGSSTEIFLTSFDGYLLIDLNRADTPEWRRWFWQDADIKSMYQFIKRTLKLLQWQRGNNHRWVLKSPHHMAFFPIVDEVFEDATYVITHRDPASSAISNACAISYQWRETYTKPDPVAGMADALDMGDNMLRGLVRDIDKFDSARVEHVYFHNYMNDVMGTLKTIYERANIPWTEEARTSLQSHVDAHPRGRHGGRLEYHPERDFKTTRAQLRERYQYYLDKFPQIQVELKHG